MKIKDFLAEDTLDETPVTENLRDWFKDKWVRFDTKGNIRGKCARGSKGEGKPKCLPQSKAHSLSKDERASAARRKRREDPNPERKGQAKNVATKKESVAEGMARNSTERKLFELLNTWHYFISFKTTHIGRTASDSNGAQELTAMARQYLGPVMNGMTFGEIMIGDLWQNPKAIPHLLKYIYQAIPYVEERVKKFVKPSDQQGYLTGIAKIKDLYKEVVALYSSQQKTVEESNSTTKTKESQISEAKGAPQPTKPQKQDSNKIEVPVQKPRQGPPMPQTGGGRHKDNRRQRARDERKLGEEELTELKCWPGHERVPGTKEGEPGSCRKKTSEEAAYKRYACEACGGPAYEDEMIAEKKDACYRKVKSRYKIWPSAYACVPEETSKALTRDGWKSVDQLAIGEEIMTYSMEKDLMEFKPILNLHRYVNAPTTVVKSGNTGFVFEATLNHKWVIKMPEQKSNRTSKYTKINGMILMETQEILESKTNKSLVVTAPYDGGTPLKKDKIFKYGDNWLKYILDITPEQRQSWLFSAIVYDGNQIKTQRVNENDGTIGNLDWEYSGNHGKQSFGFKQKEIEHRDAFLLAAFLNGGTVTWKKHNLRDIYSCYYVSNKRYKNLWNFNSVKNNVTNVWCPETENSTWVMMQETDGNGIITITGNSGALSKCRKVGAKNWGNKGKK